MILFTGAGTGGHVLTALSVIEQLRSKAPEIPILYVGAINLKKGQEGLPSIEERLCKEYRVPFIKIRTGKVQRYIEPRTFKLLAQIPLGFIDALKVVKKYKPLIVIGFGGYSTPPLIFAGKLFGAKTIIHEQTITTGLANYVSSFWADKILLSFKESKDSFPPFVRRKCEYVGYPLRDDIFRVKRFVQLQKILYRYGRSYPKKYLEQLRKLQYLKRPILLVLGGGTGAKVLNRFVLKYYRELLKNYNLVVQTGDLKEDLRMLQNLAHKVSNKHYFLVREFFYEEFGYVLNRADYVISRSGAGLTYQLGMLAKPSVLVPLPFSRNNEQFKNAKLLERLNLAVVIPQDRLTLEKVQLALQRLKDLKPSYKKLQAHFPKHAASKIADKLIALYN